MRSLLNCKIEFTVHLLDLVEKILKRFYIVNVIQLLMNIY